MKYTVRVCYRPGEWQELGQHLTMKLVESAVGAFLRDMESLEGKGAKGIQVVLEA